MAPKKKKKQYQPKAADNTNKVVVFSLVVFILLTIGLGVACYYGYAGQAELEKAAKDKATAESAAKKAAEFALFVNREFRNAAGAPLLKDEATVDEQAALKIAREDFKSGTLTDQNLKPIIEKAIDDNKKILGWDDDTQGYKTNYKKLVEDLKNEVAQLKGEKSSLEKTVAKKNKDFTDLQTMFNEKYRETQASIAKGNTDAKSDLDKKLTALDDYIKKSQKLEQEIAALKLKHTEDIRERGKLINELAAELSKTKDQLFAGQGKKGGAGSRPTAGQQHALLLDVSKGRALWDEPRGKILSVNPAKREAIINLGSADGVQKGLTFNVFGANGNNGGALGPLKGSIEIKEVLNSGSSIGQINALFDATGKEIPLYHAYKNLTLENPGNQMQEGDLLYNMFWKARVALAGKFNTYGYKSPSMAEDMRQLKLFAAKLQKQGMQVDAYIDLTTGEIVGEMTPETHFLIFRDFGKDYDPKMKAGPDPELAKKIATNIEEMKKQAVDLGMFLISSENYKFVTGYRPPQSADSTQVFGFQAILPTAGEGKMNGAGGPNGKAPEKEDD